MSGRVAIVTGASSGIGAAACRLLAERGDTVVLVARRADRLQTVAEELKGAGGTARVLAADLADPVAVSALVGTVVEEFGRIDLLLNNAGYGLQVRFETMSQADIDRMFQVNVLALASLCREVIPIMRKQGDGAIVNIASVGGVVAHPLNAAYCASKHAVVGLSKSLHLEMAGTGVRVVVVCPGATRTEFFDQARRDVPFAAMIHKNMVPAEVVAKAAVRAADSRRAVIFPTWGAWAMAMADRWLPWISAWGNVRYRDHVLGLPQK